MSWLPTEDPRGDDLVTMLETSDTSMSGNSHGSLALVRKASPLLVVGALASMAVGMLARGPGQQAQAEASAMSAGLQQLDDLGCSGEFQDCRQLKCCKRAGQICFEKNEFWATCMDSCAPGVHAGDQDTKPWSCKKLGNRTRFEVGCSWPGEDCAKTSTCCSRGFQCAVKDKDFTGCTQIEQGPWDMNNKPAAKLSIPDDWDGKVLGGWHSEFKVNSVAPGTGAGVRLFCFMAVLPGSPETALVDLARGRGAHIFACDGHGIYDVAKSEYHEWYPGVSSLMNTAAFVDVWHKVHRDGRFANFDWTAKVDADCVFLPDRLRSHLQTLSAPKYMPVYVKNVAPGLGLNGGFLGAIEILSKTAVETFVDNVAKCEKFIGTVSGEDGFLKDCLDSLGVGFVEDFSLLYRTFDPKLCSATQQVAFHPYKAPDDWTACYELATR